MTTHSIGVVGAGAWGTALASVAARNGHDVLIWAYEPEVAAAINETHENTTFLAGVALDPAIRASDDLGQMAGRDVVLMVTPAQALRAVGGQLKDHLEPGTPVVICSKGIERESRKLMSDVLGEAMPDVGCYVLSGPSFAADVARGLPTAVTCAGADIEATERVAAMIGSNTFRAYSTDDVIGAQVGGAVKNVLAIACGIVDGKGFGASARAALTTRGFIEIVRIGEALGARPETLSGLSGLGDLILTCNSTQSRNMSLGKALGEGRSLDDIMGERKSVSEGVHTAAVVNEIGEAHGLDLPIAAAVHAVVSGQSGVDEAIEDLLARPVGRE